MGIFRSQKTKKKKTVLGASRAGSSLFFTPYTFFTRLPRRLLKHVKARMAQGRIWVKNRKIYNSGEIY